MKMLVVAAALAACAGDDDRGSGVHVDAATDAAIDAAIDAARPDGPRYVCEPQGRCDVGVECGTGCCDAGERCVDGTCMCGNDAACLDGDWCTAGGPALPSHGCGYVCCGPASGVGCPI